MEKTLRKKEKLGKLKKLRKKENFKEKKDLRGRQDKLGKAIETRIRNKREKRDTIFGFMNSSFLNGCHWKTQITSLFLLYLFSSYTLLVLADSLFSWNSTDFSLTLAYLFPWWKYLIRSNLDQSWKLRIVFWGHRIIFSV